MSTYLSSKPSPTPEERTQRLLHWDDAPAARIVHAEEDHLLPLMAAVGAAEGEPGRCVHHETAGFNNNLSVSSFRFG